MDIEKSLKFIEESFLSPLILDSNVTDISYNGESIYFLHNYLGRKKSEIQIDETGARDFIRQIANLAEKQFSIQTPKLDVSVNRFRINATHPSIGRRKNQNCLTFAIRATSSQPIITRESSFLNASLLSLFDVILRSHISTIIGGLTGCGKTEFQKYLIRSMESYSRVIVVDNILELDNLSLDRDLDINIWQADEKNKEATIQELVKNALRSNPDWLIVAESRGKEMIEVLNSALTGHPIITTIHAMDVNSMPTRIARMVQMNEQKQDFETLMQDILYTFRFYVYLRRVISKNGEVKRYVEEVAEIDQDGRKHTIYQNKKGKITTFKIRNEFLELLDYEDNEIFKDIYVGKEK